VPHRRSDLPPSQLYSGVAPYGAASAWPQQAAHEDHIGTVPARLRSQRSLNSWRSSGREVFADGLVVKKISSIGDSRDCQSGSSIKRTTRMIRLVPAQLCAPQDRLNAKTLITTPRL
jgi:hypothetical protein